ncbi:MAG: hypothetical protein ACK55Z_29990, partial [bacterium]
MLIIRTSASRRRSLSPKCRKSKTYHHADISIRRQNLITKYTPLDKKMGNTLTSPPAGSRKVRNNTGPGRVLGTKSSMLTSSLKGPGTEGSS